MPRPSIDQIRGLPDIASLYQWNVIVVPSSGLSFLPNDADINIRCTSTTLPKANSEDSEIIIRGHKIHQAGLLTYEPTITLTMVETIDNMITQMTSDWSNACTAPVTGVHGNRNEVQTSVILERLDRADSPIWRYTLIGCWLSDYDQGGELGSETDYMKPTLTLTYDYFTQSAI